MQTIICGNNCYLVIVEYISDEEKRELTRENYWAMISCDFKVGVKEEECFYRLQIGCGNGGPSPTYVFRCFIEFITGQNSLLNDEHTRILFTFLYLQ